MLCFGTTQDIPAGLYQREFQDTASLSYTATVPAKNTLRHSTHRQTHTNTHQYYISKTKMTYSDRRQNKLAREQSTREKKEPNAAAHSCVFNSNTLTKLKYCTCTVGNQWLDG